MPISIRLLNGGDTAPLANVAPDVFDNAVDVDAARAFLDDPNHFIAVAMDETKDSLVVGFVSAVKTYHPDKPAPELWVNEVGVASPYQQQGIAKKNDGAALCSSPRGRLR